MEKVYQVFMGAAALSFKTVIAFLKVLFFSSWKISFPPTQKETCCILGNGPSLNQSLDTHLEFLKQAELFCVNNFACSDYFTILQPTNYVLLDPYFFLYDGKTYNSPQVKQTLDAIAQTTSWKLNLFVPYSAKSSSYWHLQITSNPHISICYFNYTPIEGFNAFCHFLYRKKLATPRCRNVLGASLYLAITRKFKKVYLLGADHSWHEEIRIDENNSVLLKQTHFYDEQNAKHHQVYDVVTKSNPKISALFMNFARAFYSYEVLKRYAEYMGVKVYNASAKSYIDAFERLTIH